MAVARSEVDFSNGWEAAAADFITHRSTSFGKKIIGSWASGFDERHTILDVGCGFGGPYTRGLLDSGVEIVGIDASRTLLQEYHARYPHVVTKCEAAESSSFFDRTFDGILSVGLIFLLPEESQIQTLTHCALALKQGGKFLFTAPTQICEWDDLSTGRKSQSLGRDAYLKLLQQQGLVLTDEYTDEGKSHYYAFQKKPSL